MAAPRVFVSSTFFDLRHLRGDLERFIREMGYDPVLHERGDVPYGPDEPLDEYCYREINLCDILVSIVGSRYGSEASSGEGSVSQKEIRTALDLGKQVYVFVEQGVLNEHKTWKLNKDRKDIKYDSVQDVRIFAFISEVYGLKNNNQIIGFYTGDEIFGHLKKQWAGLFQRYLDNARALEKGRTIEKLESTVATLERVVTALSSQVEHGQHNVIFLLNHPAFRELRAALKIPIRVAFYDVDELDELLTSFRFARFHDADDPEFLQWSRIKKATKDGVNVTQYVQVSHKLFDERGSLIPINPATWDENTEIKVFDIEPPKDDLPF